MFSVFLQGEYNEKNCLRQARRRAFRAVVVWVVQVQAVLGAGSAANGAGSKTRPEPAPQICP
jgi:hypothetical protein